MKGGFCALLLTMLLALPGNAQAAEAGRIADMPAQECMAVQAERVQAAEASYSDSGITYLTAQQTAAPAAQASAAPADEVDDADVYRIVTEDGQLLTSRRGRIYVDDEYISGDNKLYRIISVDESTKTAVAQLIGDEDMTGLSSEVVATIATDAKKLICIYSTHSDESYIPTDGTESKTKDAGIYDVDESLKSSLEKLGIEVELDTTTHLPHDAGAYRRSRVTATRLMEQQPAALLDIHRDGIPDPDEYVTKVDGENMTKVRLEVGKSNPNGDANRKFAKQIKATADEMYPGLVKDIYIGKGDYNQELMPRAVLLEFGTHTTSKERAIKSTNYMAQVLNSVLFGSTAKAAGADEGTGAGNNAGAGGAAASRGGTEGEGGNGSMWGILWVIGIAIAAIIIYGLVTTGSFSGMWEKIKRGTSETTGGLFGKKRDKEK